MSDTAPAPSPRLPLCTLAAYGQIGFPLAIADLPIIIYLVPFYTGDLGLAVATAGLIKMLARIGDVFTDPIIGALSDRTRLKLGRRRTWILAGLPVTLLGVFMLFIPPDGADALHLFVWLSVFSLGWTMITIPYGALGAEISDDYGERSRITGARAMFVFAGILIASLAPIFAGGGVGTEAGVRPIMNFLGLGTLMLLPISVAVLALGVPEPPVREQSRLPYFKGLALAARNKPFVRLIAATFIGRVGSGMNQSMVLWFFAFAMGLPPEIAGLPLLVWLTLAVMGAPLWMYLGARWSKHRALSFSVFLAVGSFSTLLLMPDGALGLSMIAMAVAGTAGAASFTLGTSMAADVIEYDNLRGREQRAGLLVALWGLVGKLADAIGIGLAAILVAQFGFSPNAPVDETASLGLTLAYVVAPALIGLSTVPFYWNFPITPDVQRRIRAIVAKREARAHTRRPNASASSV